MTIIAIGKKLVYNIFGWLRFLCYGAFRMKRGPSERLHDKVDGELLKEREVIEGVASLLQRVLEQISEQIR